eukprot:892696-Pelagomonas_calceolata.AAC.8
MEGIHGALAPGVLLSLIGRECFTASVVLLFFPLTHTQLRDYSVLRGLIAHPPWQLRGNSVSHPHHATS